MPIFNKRRLISLTVAMMVAASAGCGPATGTVSGTVVFGKDRLPFGTVQLFTDKGDVFSSLIDDTGGYCLRDVPPGPARLAVVTHPEVPPGLTVAPPAQHPAYPGPVTAAARRRFVPIPERYGRPDQSGLTLTVVAGKQNLDIALTP